MNRSETATGIVYAVTVLEDKFLSSFANVHERIDEENEQARQALRSFLINVNNLTDEFLHTVVHDVLGLTEEEVERLKAPDDKVVALRDVSKDKNDARSVD